MLEDDIENLARRDPQRNLGRLETDIWVAVADRERTARISRRLLAVQAGVLTLTLFGALLAGKYAGSDQDGSGMDIFSPRMALSASTLLVGQRP